VNVESLTVQTYASNTLIAQNCQYLSIRTKFADTMLNFVRFSFPFCYRFVWWIKSSIWIEYLYSLLFPIMVASYSNTGIKYNRRTTFLESGRFHTLVLQPGINSPNVYTTYQTLLLLKKHLKAYFFTCCYQL